MAPRSEVLRIASATQKTENKPETLAGRMLANSHQLQKKEDAMHSRPIRPVPVKPCNARDLEARLESVQDQTRRRAYELYCRRGNRKGSALEDWKMAERERDAAPLVGVADEDRDIHIAAFIPDANASEVIVDALPNEIVVEADRNGKIERFTRLRMPARIDADRVKARLCGAELEVVAPKTGK
jgi:HSP20 family molecular chaperone IbpA